MRKGLVCPETVLSVEIGGVDVACAAPRNGSWPEGIQARAISAESRNALPLLCPVASSRMYAVRVHGLNLQLASNLSSPVGIVLLGEINGGEQVGFHGFLWFRLLTDGECIGRR